VGKQEGKIPLGKPRRQGENNIKVDLRETGLSGIWHILEYLSDWQVLKKDSAPWS
jgi:hypothetical protein